MSRGGPRPGAGRRSRADPTTADEAARELGRYLSGGVWPSRTGDIVIDLPAAVALLAKLRRRKSTNRTEKP